MLRIAGLDLGQSADYTALCVVDATGTPRDLEVPTTRYSQLTGQYYNTVERVPDEGRPVKYEVRHLERFALGTRYPAIVDRVVELVRLAECAGLVVDATGVGAPVVDMLRQRDLNPIAVVITGGDTATVDEASGTIRVPKRDLVGAVLIALQGGRFEIADSPEAATLVKEMVNFDRKITPAAHDTYGAWREGTHDDLILAVALACWAADARFSPPTVRTLTDFSALRRGW